MMPVIWLLIVQGALGAADTLWYHEWKVALHSRAGARRELVLHSLRNFCYASLYGMLAWREWHGPVAAVFFGLLAAELVITLSDFLEEDRTRKLPGGERVMHALVGVAWGAMLVYFLPVVWGWLQQPAALVAVDYGAFSWVLALMAAGAAGFGLRDGYYASRQFDKVLAP
jgi:hypothetical protein